MAFLQPVVDNVSDSHQRILPKFHISCNGFYVSWNFIIRSLSEMPNAKIKLQDFNPDLTPNCKETSSRTGWAVIRGKSALCSLYVWTIEQRIKEARWRLADAKQIPSMLNIWTWQAESTSCGVRCRDELQLMREQGILLIYFQPPFSNEQLLMFHVLFHVIPVCFPNVVWGPDRVVV